MSGPQKVRGHQIPNRNGQICYQRAALNLGNRPVQPSSVMFVKGQFHMIPLVALKKLTCSQKYLEIAGSSLGIAKSAKTAKPQCQMVGYIRPWTSSKDGIQQNEQ